MRSLLWAPLLVVPWPGAARAQVAAGPSAAPPSRALSLELCRAPRLAGTSGSLHAVELVARVLEEAGFAVELDRREVLLSLPRRLELALFEDARASAPLLERIQRYDPDARPPGDLPPFSAWTASGEARGEVVDVGHGSREDFERLRAARVDLAGKVALCRYGHMYRGVKVELAQEYGCAALLLFTPSSEDGAERGAVWPDGPWKPPHETQRGAVGPMAQGPGDPSTPGWPSPAPGVGARRASPEELEARLPRILVLPIGAGDAEAILARLARRRMGSDENGERITSAVGPGPVVAQLVIDAPRELRPIVNVIGHLAGQDDDFVMAGNHRDAWVRGARDAGSGTVALLRAAQLLGARARAGWKPAHGIRLAFWDAEESGLVGSTEWGEAHADEVRDHALAYLNGDAVVGGLELSAAGLPGMERTLLAALEGIVQPGKASGEPPNATLADAWRASFPDGAPELGLVGSGSDFTVFVHHLGVPVLDLSFGGVGAGEYHTAFDDFPLMDRFLDPGWVGHETAAALFAALLAQIAEGPSGVLDDRAAALAFARLARAAAPDVGEEPARAIAEAFEALERAIAAARERGYAGEGPSFLRSLECPAGLPARPWFKNQLWAPALELGYGAETFPRLRAAPDDAARGAATEELVASIEHLRAAWEALR